MCIIIYIAFEYAILQISQKSISSTKLGVHHAILCFKTFHFSTFSWKDSIYFWSICQWHMSVISNATAFFYSDELVLIIYLCSVKFSKVWGISKLRIRTEYWFVFRVIFKLTLSTRMNICNTYVFPYLADLSWCILLDAEVYWLP